MVVSPPGAKGACREGVLVCLNRGSGIPVLILDLDDDDKAANFEAQRAGRLAPCAPELRVLDPGRLYLDDDPSTSVEPNVDRRVIRYKTVAPPRWLCRRTKIQL